MPPARIRPPLSPRHAAFGRAIEELRRESRLTQEQLAERMSTTFTRVGLLERGAVDFKFSTQLRIASALEIELARLVERFEVIVEGDVKAG